MLSRKDLETSLKLHFVKLRLVLILASNLISELALFENSLNVQHHHHHHRYHQRSKEPNSTAQSLVGLYIIRSPPTKALQRQLYIRSSVL